MAQARTMKLRGRRGLGAASRRAGSIGTSPGSPSTREDRVYLICRGDHPVIVYDRKGNFLRSWGEGDFTYRTHGITVGPDGTVYCTDDGNHTVRQFTPRRQAADDARHHEHALRHRATTARHSIDIPRAAGPFNRPTNVAIGPKGDLYVSDGYGNCRVHQLLAHRRAEALVGRARARARASSTCRTASRWRPTGACSSATARTTASRSSAPTASTSPSGPTRSGRRTSCSTGQGRAYVSELWWHKGQTSQRHGPIAEARARPRAASTTGTARCSRAGAGRTPTAAGSFAAPHGIAVDSKNDLYVSEVTWTFAVSRGLAPADCHTFQKFALRG